MTSSTSVTCPGGRSATRRTFFSSSMRLVLVWSRPAVSASTRSAWRAAACWTASKTTAPGSPPSLPRMMAAPTRSAHSSSWSAAAARKVSPAAITTRWPWRTWRIPSLPMVVVLPTPLTPTNSHTLVTSGSRCSSLSPSRVASSSALRAPTRSSGLVIPSCLTRPRMSSRMRPLSPAPTSARIRASSSSSQVLVVDAVAGPHRGQVAGEQGAGPPSRSRILGGSGLDSGASVDGRPRLRRAPPRRGASVDRGRRHRPVGAGAAPVESGRGGPDGRREAPAAAAPATTKPADTRAIDAPPRSTR